MQPCSRAKDAAMSRSRTAPQRTIDTASRTHVHQGWKHARASNQRATYTSPPNLHPFNVHGSTFQMTNLPGNSTVAKKIRGFLYVYFNWKTMGDILGVVRFYEGHTLQPICVPLIIIITAPIKAYLSF